MRGQFIRFIVLKHNKMKNAYEWPYPQKLVVEVKKSFQNNFKQISIIWDFWS